ncbi:MAG TPA: 4Fe-4S dicluster domain-containing protein [Candidatus Acidoferrales bacterium]|nr:4Fe-4S dicluster domain-containing protein [Candidatus Acidoferrales bacterium]
MVEKASGVRLQASASPLRGGVNWHRVRRRVQVACFLVFMILPFLNVIRFDIPRQRFYFAGYELWISEFAIVFFALMFLMFLIVLMSVFFGRIYCGYLCPQMIFSEASAFFEQWLKRKRVPRPKLAFLAVVAAGSVVLAFLFISYFAPPSLSLFGTSTAAGVCGAVVTLLTFLDFAFLRQKFCTTACPYGYLQGLLADDKTLLVQYQDSAHDCIECQKCVRVCPMGIDIRKSPFQIECVHCGECIDACESIMTRLHQRNLIGYTFGGFRDAKRVVVLGVLLAYAGGLFAALSMRHEMLVRIDPMRETLYRVGTDGRIYNRFRFQIDNRGHKAGSVVFSIHQLPGAALAMETNPVRLDGGASTRGEFQISRPGGKGGELVTHFTILTATVPGREVSEFPMTFLAPGEGK